LRAPANTTEMNSAITTRILDGQHTFITGGTSGINLGIARRLVQAGSKVTVLGRKPEKAQAAADGLNAEVADSALAVTGDVRDPAALQTAFAAAVAKFGPIDVLVCGAAGNFPAPALAMSPNAFKSVVDIDLLGTFNAARVGFEHLRNPGARVVVISAPQAGLPTLMQSHVCAAKAGVDMLTKTLALEWGPLGVRVNGIWPGPIAGTEGMERLTPDDAARERVRKSVPLQRFGSVEDVAELALWLSSSSAAYVSGGIFCCDGGLSLVGFHSVFPS
jgi:NAD(P)-dependent dehydrogenase (short-subunit alcohol dehydrogenase family)